MRQTPEGTAEILRILPNNARQLLKREGAFKVFFYVLQHRFDLINTVHLHVRYRCIRYAETVLSDQREQSAQASHRIQFRRNPLGRRLKSGHQLLRDPHHRRIFSAGVKAFGNLRLPVEGPEVIFYHVHTAEQAVQIKYKALVRASVGDSAVEHTAANQKYIPFVCEILLFLQIDYEFAGQDTQNFPFTVPVKRHPVAGMMAIHVIIFRRKRRRTVPRLIKMRKCVHTSPKK